MLIFHLTLCSYFTDAIFYIPKVISKFVLNVIYFLLIVFVYPKLSLSICFNLHILLDFPHTSGDI